MHDDHMKKKTSRKINHYETSVTFDLTFSEHSKYFYVDNDKFYFADKCLI